VEPVHVTFHLKFPALPDPVVDHRPEYSHFQVSADAIVAVVKTLVINSPNTMRMVPSIRS
jgi:hypothetical protein